MNQINKIVVVIGIVFMGFLSSCEDLEELNVNPNGVDPAVADLNLLLPTIISELSKNMVGIGFGNLAGVMQHTQKNGWSSSHNDYDWDNTNQSWKSFYGVLRNNKDFLDKAEEQELEFHQGVGLILKSYTFGAITDLWGDAPYSQALRADEGSEFFDAPFDNQKDIYLGILADLEKANVLLSKNQDSYTGMNSSQDILFNGQASGWRKLANSLALRYYMRLSLKEPGLAETGIKKITGNPSQYPLILNISDEANLAYEGADSSNSWPTNTVFDNSATGSYFRVKMCATLVEALKGLNDPRLAIWANPIEYPLLLDTSADDDDFTIIDGVRHVSQKTVDDYEATSGLSVNYDTDYIGMPASIKATLFFNITPNLGQGTYNPHASQLNDRYKKTSGDLLLARLLSAAEINFILAEGVTKGWVAGDAATYYNEGVKQSLDAWGVGSTYSDYISGAPFVGLESIMQQKWIAGWSASTESWLDYRRTGLPNLQTGENAQRAVLPIRFYYHFNDEIANNTENAEAAISKLETTDYKGNDNKNSAWSKMWLLQGTNQPY